MPHATIENDITDHAASMNDFAGFGDTTFDDDYDNEKAVDAQDFEDISDDDLPEEEEATNHFDDDPDELDAISNALRSANGMPEFSAKEAEPKHDEELRTNGRAHVNGADTNEQEQAEPDTDIFGDDIEYNDLFGERLSPVQERHPEPVQQSQPQPIRRPGLVLPGNLPLPKLTQSPPDSPPSLVHESFSPEEAEDDDGDDEEEDTDPAVLAQRELFKMSQRRIQGERVDFEVEDQVKFWQRFAPWEEDQVPRFYEILPTVPSKFAGKAPLRPPRTLQMTKPALEILPDQKKSFLAATIPGAPILDGYNGRNLIRIEEKQEIDDDSDVVMEDDFDDDEVIGNVTLRDINILCQNWDIPSPTLSTVDDDNGDYEAADRARSAKKSKPATSVELPRIPTFALPNLDDAEATTARIAKQVTLDMNDPYLLLDEQSSSLKRKRLANGQLAYTALSAKDMARRYNVSMDEAYDLLKENHQHKVRGTLGGVAIEHSMPAARLQWPFYVVNMDMKDKRAFHRPRLHLRDHARQYRVSKAKFQKKKHVRGRDPKDLFFRAEDLTLGDNSNVLMLEYSEEHPTMLSNFGMGNRIINYYRKLHDEDEERPKREIGETRVLLGQDKSPFANFGHVDAGETVPTIQNGMYRAPIFSHESRPTDFILAVSNTHEGGSKFYLRNTENLHVVGQQLPVSEVPGEHSRRVTDAARRRLRMVSWRIYLKNVDSEVRGPPLTFKQLMKHIPGSDIPQTRSKMREFMRYEKKAKNSEDDGYWVPKPPDDKKPDEPPQPTSVDQVVGWVSPEEICLLESTQVGVQHLHDLGISTSKHEEENEEEELEDGAHIEKKLAPWQTTKNFLAATQSKAMLALHGEGDPTGRGEGFSFIRTSMKGGYVAEGESIEDRLTDRRKKEQGGHKYNVATQLAKYDNSIRIIWDRQKNSLSNGKELPDADEDDDMVPPDEAEFPYGNAATPRTSFGTPAANFDDSASQFSRQSADVSDEVLIIKRRQQDDFGEWHETTERVDNPKIIKLYKKRKQAMQLSNLSHDKLKPTGDAEIDALAKQNLQKELNRLERNAERRIAREKQKSKLLAMKNGGNLNAAATNLDSPDSPSSDLGTDQAPVQAPIKGGKGRTKDGTARKCANCGQVGHIKTNRKLCPMLNGTWKPEDAPGAQNSSFGAAPAQLSL